MAAVVYGAVAAYQIYSGMNQADAIQRNARLAREIARMNAEKAELDAFNAERDGYTAQARYQTVIDATLSAQKAQFNAIGVDTTSGTVRDLQSEARVTGFLNAQDIQNQAHARALGFKNEAANIRLQSALNYAAASQQAQATREGAIIGAVQTGLTGYAKYGASTPAATASNAPATERVPLQSMRYQPLSGL